MKIYGINKIIETVMVVTLLIPLISCSGEDKKATNPPVKKIVGKKSYEVKERKIKVVSKITCDKCHKIDGKGNLIFPSNGNEGAKPAKNTGFAH